MEIGDVKYEQSILDLMKAIDDFIPTPERELTQPFLLAIEDVCSITGRGTVVTGRVERGQVKIGDEVEIVGLQATRKCIVSSLEMYRQTLDVAEAGDNVGALLRGVDRVEVERGQVIAQPGSISARTKFGAEMYVLTKEEGGRHTPFLSGYRPQFFLRTTDVTGNVQLPEGVTMVMPGDNVKIIVELDKPVAAEAGTTFAIREGGHTVGAGIVSSIIE